MWAGLARAAAPGLRLMLAERLRRGKELPGRLAERRGLETTPRPPGRLVWLHAASVGETTSALPLLRHLLRAEGLNVLFTTGTVTAAALLGQRLPADARERVLHRFVPLDVPAWATRFLDHWRPDAAGFVESELWPNLLAACRARGIPLMLINARMSDRSFARWRRAPGFAAHVLGAFDRIQARSDSDAARLRSLTQHPVESPGDLKLAAEPLPVDETELARLQAALAGRPVWLAASTHPGEEGAIFAAHRELLPRFPELLTIIAPRHPERGDAIAEEAAPLPVARRSIDSAPLTKAGIWIADTLGELGLWYRLAPIAFIGRSLIAPGGGQNPLEPARLGCAIATGPYTGNFTDHIAMLRAAGAVAVVKDATELAGFVAEMLADEPGRAAMGNRARVVVRPRADVPAIVAATLLELLPARR